MEPVLWLGVVRSGLWTLLLLGAIIILRFKQSCYRQASRSIPSQKRWSLQMCRTRYLWEMSGREACLPCSISVIQVTWYSGGSICMFSFLLPMHWILFGGVKTQLNSYLPKTNYPISCTHITPITLSDPFFVCSLGGDCVILTYEILFERKLSSWSSHFFI